MSSRVSGIVQVILAASLNPAPAGVSVDPLPLNAPEPYVTVREISGVELESQDGRSDLIDTIIQISCWHKDYEVAWSLREAINNLLFPFTGAAEATGQVIDYAGHLGGGSSRELYHNDLEIWESISRLRIWWG